MDGSLTGVSHVDLGPVRHCEDVDITKNAFFAILNVPLGLAIQLIKRALVILIKCTGEKRKEEWKSGVCLLTRKCGENRSTQMLSLMCLFNKVQSRLACCNTG